MMKHRFQLISIVIFSLFLISIASIAADDGIPQTLLEDNDNSVIIEENNGSNEDNRSDATPGTTINTGDNDKLSGGKSIKTGDTTKNNSDDDEDNENKSKLAWDTPYPSSNSPSSDDTYESLYDQPFTKLYDRGVQAYLENNWNDCIVYLEIAVHEFKVYRQGTINCRLQCQYQNEREEPFYQVTTDGLQFFDLILKRTVCLNSCYKKALKQQYFAPFFVSQYYFERFLSMRPYEYLQLCYYRVS